MTCAKRRTTAKRNTGPATAIDMMENHVIKREAMPAIVPEIKEEEPTIEAA